MEAGDLSPKVEDAMTLREDVVAVSYTHLGDSLLDELENSGLYL